MFTQFHNLRTLPLAAGHRGEIAIVLQIITGRIIGGRA
ncbi:hypothetical protein ETAA8_61310 [Anatilimnocola aggregata]|uniref:Uncharacterized protein n=1 Tax=Anatilimnocola aggregata TaxID=2528021 RepID=A0A517YL96_9BACT|nr:hypothetical protein ETAA8_61310 [Anatilimnocola aggregata]